jgi:hypothetical protein
VIWERVVRLQGAEFMTATHLPFTYKVEGDSGIWFYRDGERIDRRLWKGEFEEASKKLPLRKTTDLRKFQCSSYLFGLLTDSRILGGNEVRKKNG